MQGVSEVSQIDHETERAEARWQALVARIEQATAADYVCDCGRVYRCEGCHEYEIHLRG